MTMTMAKTKGTESKEQDRGLIEIYDGLSEVRSQTKHQTSLAAANSLGPSAILTVSHPLYVIFMQ
jgi:hypothetical protein